MKNLRPLFSCYNSFSCGNIWRHGGQPCKEIVIQRNLSGGDGPSRPGKDPLEQYAGENRFSRCLGTCLYNYIVRRGNS